MNSMNQSVIRHFTSTGFVIHKNCLLLHWHGKVKAWLPPGGHIEKNEDPCQTLKREILEETGLEVEIVNFDLNLGFKYPEQLPAPFTILVEDIEDRETGKHQHIDMIYFCRPITSETGLQALKPGWIWVEKKDLDNGVPLKNDQGDLDTPPEDVLILASHAFEAVNLSM